MASMRRRLLRSMACALSVSLVSLPVGAAAAADRVVFTIRDTRITESSGLARDTRSGVFWTANDSGSQATVYGLAPDGSVRGILGFRVQPVDIEALAMHDRRLYVADIGDNRSERNLVSVYYVDNPRPDNQTVAYRSYDFAYPDGPHDAETLLVNGHGRLFIVTKGLKAGIYAGPRVPSRQGTNSLERVGDAPSFVTDGVFLPTSGGQERIVLRTYVSVEVLDGSTYRTLARAPAPLQPQGESIALTMDGRNLLVGSEGKSSKVYQIAVPTKIGSAPSAGSLPPPIQKPSARSSPSSGLGDREPPEDPNAGVTSSRAGTVLALALAGLVAVVAGVVAGAAGRRR